MKKSLPIFPLGLVVFPKSKYPLHIFEERYKKMISECIEQKSAFGIVSQVDKSLSKVGSLVTVNNILKTYDNGEMDIVVKCLSRFSIIDLFEHPDGYYIAEVEEYKDVETEIDRELINRLKAKFEKILAKFHFQLDESFWKNYRYSRKKSFKLAEKSGLTLEQQQVLLTLQDENERIHYLIDHFEMLDEQISKNAAVKSIVLGDGFLN
jgi:ATP-dependent Lon protease